MEVENREFFGKIRILMVDNDSTCRLITVVSLKKSNFEVTTVKSAKDALAILRSSILSFDLMVTEVHMPEMDGFQLQQEIAKESNIPVVFFSVDDKKSTTMKGLQSGVIFFIVKPMSQEDIHHLWQYVTLIRKKKEVLNQKNTNEKIPHDTIYIDSSSSDDKRDKSAKKYDETENDQSSSPPSKKTRIVWTVSPHDKFLDNVTTTSFESQLNIQSSNVQGDYENFTAEECLFLQNIFLNQEHEKEKYDGITAHESSSYPNNILSNSKSQQEDYGYFAGEDYSFFHNVLNQELEHKNYGDATTEKESFQLHNDHPNSKLEKKIHDDITIDEGSFHLHNVFQNSEPQQEDYENFTAEECSFLHNIFLNQEHKQGNNEDVTIEQRSFQLHYDHLNSKSEV